MTVSDLGLLTEEKELTPTKIRRSAALNTSCDEYSSETTIVLENHVSYSTPLVVTFHNFVEFNESKVMSECHRLLLSCLFLPVFEHRSLFNELSSLFICS